jgi:hypothetical protein
MVAALATKSGGGAPPLITTFAQRGTRIFRRLLAAGEIAGYVFNSEDGVQVLVPEHFWNSAGAGEVLWKDIPATFDVEGKHVCGRIVFKLLELATLLTAFATDLRPSTCRTAPSLQEGISPSWFATRTSSSANGTLLDEPASADAPGPTQDLPYVALMRRAQSELGLKPTKRIPKKTIEQWIKANWPTELGPCTGKKVGMMGTFLRDPAHERGGNLTSQEAASTGRAKRFSP